MSIDSTPNNQSIDNFSHKKTPHKEGVLLEKEVKNIIENFGYNVKYNVITTQIGVFDENKRTFQPFTDLIDNQIFCDIKEKIYTENSQKLLQKETFDRAIKLLANEKENQYNPIKDFFYLAEIESQTTWLDKNNPQNFFSFFKDKNGVFESYLLYFMFGCIEKLFSPNGWQNPILILEGKQGIGKSFFVEWLASPFIDYFKSGELKSEKDGLFDLVENWLFDWSEGANLGAKGAEWLKHILTQNHIKERAVYGRFKEARKVIMNIIMTKNQNGNFLKDLTGNRRFHICDLISIDKEYSELINPLDLWKEVYTKWFLTSPFDYDGKKQETFVDKQIAEKGTFDWKKDLVDKAKRDEINNSKTNRPALYDDLDSIIEKTDDNGILYLTAIFDTLEIKDKTFDKHKQKPQIIQYFQIEHGAELLQRTGKNQQAGYKGFCFR